MRRALLALIVVLSNGCCCRDRPCWRGPCPPEAALPTCDPEDEERALTMAAVLAAPDLANQVVLVIGRVQLSPWVGRNDGGCDPSGGPDTPQYLGTLSLRDDDAKTWIDLQGMRMHVFGTSRRYCARVRAEGKTVVAKGRWRPNRGPSIIRGAIDDAKLCVVASDHARNANLAR
jgi:hypothetical protein